MGKMRRKTWEQHGKDEKSWREMEVLMGNMGQNGEFIDGYEFMMKKGLKSGELWRLSLCSLVFS